MYLYIHIPFCESKCSYCRFASTGSLQEVQIEQYVNFITSPLKPLFNNKEVLKSIYFGGGTPGVLTIKQLKKILDYIKKNVTFDKNIEITLESTPNKITKENLIEWKGLGINRLSMGVQSLNIDTLKEIGREDKGNILNALKNIEEIGFKNISLDFIIGLPYTKKGDTKKDIKYILNNYSFIKHISVYMLEDYYYPGNWENISINQEDYLGEYIEVQKYLEIQNFNKYELSNFALSNYECKHNMAYWDHSDIKAIGLASSGFLKTSPPTPLLQGEGSNRYIRYKYSDNFSDFYSGKGFFTEKLTPRDVFIEKVMFGLRTSGLGETIYLKLNQEKIDEFILGGYLIIENKKLKLMGKGVLVLDYIIKEILFTT